MACTASSAVQTQGEVTVSVRVLPRTSLVVQSAPPDLVISALDVRRSYIDVGEPTRLEISNNSPAGYALLIVPTARIFTAITVRGAGGAAELGRDGGAILERGRAGLHIPLSLSFRFRLGPEVAPGRYPWPLHLAVRPLPAS